MDQLGHPEDALVVVDPLLHVPELDVADDVVDPDEQPVSLAWSLAAWLEPGEEVASVVAALDEQVLRLAVRCNRGEPDVAVVVFELVGGLHAARAVGDRVLVGGRGIRDAQRDLVHAVAVSLVVLGDLVVTGQRPGEDETDPALLEHVRDAVAAARLEPAVSGLGEAERVRVVVGGLGGVPDEQLQVVDAVDWHRVDDRCRRTRELLCLHRVQ